MLGFPMFLPRRHFRPSLQGSKAFTLVELVVFSSIIVTFASLAINSMYTFNEQRKLRMAAIELSGYLQVARSVALAENVACTIALTQSKGGLFAPDPKDTTNSCRKGTISPSLNLGLFSASNSLTAQAIPGKGSFPITFSPEGTIRDGVTVLISSEAVSIGSWCVEVQAPLATVRTGWRQSGANAKCVYTTEQ